MHPESCMTTPLAPALLRFPFTLGVLIVGAAFGCATSSPPPAPSPKAHVEAPRQAGGVQTVSGEVLGVDRVPASAQNELLLHLNVDPNQSRPVSVSLGPGWYFDQAGIHFEPHEHVVVHGREQLVEGRRVFRVEQLEKGDSVRLERAEDGTWSQPETRP
jgi:hypothetical protein